MMSIINTTRLITEYILIINIFEDANLDIIFINLVKIIIV